MPLRVQTQAEKGWRRVCGKMLRFIWQVIFSRALAAQSQMYRLTVAVASPTFRDALETMATGGIRAPPTKQVPKKVAEAAQAKVQVKCSHRLETGADAIRTYGAGRHGYFAKCQLCERRWKWQVETESWIDPPAVKAKASSKASSPLAQSLGAQPEARPSSSPSAREAINTPVDPRTRCESFEMMDYASEEDVYTDFEEVTADPDL